MGKFDSFMSLTKGEANQDSSGEWQVAIRNPSKELALLGIQTKTPNRLMFLMYLKHMY